MKTVGRILLFLLLHVSVATTAWAQQFEVETFRLLPNDVSAFITPVRDNNDEDCGLLKVMAPEEFVFSTPLGIVRREDKVGEIWLYIPCRSKRITIKHSDWGVLRDYQFPTKIESHMTYEMRLKVPRTATEATAVEPIVTTVIDTLVVTRVDTLVMAPVKPPVPLRLVASLTAGWGGRSATPLAGVTVMALKRHGAFLSVATDFGRVGSLQGTCERDGSRNGVTPYYSGLTRHRAWMVTGGLAHRLSRSVTLHEGVGWGETALAWQLAPSEGSGWVKNSYYSTRGLAATAGVTVTQGRVAVSAVSATIKGREWFGMIGIGIKLGR